MPFRWPTLILSVFVLQFVSSCSYFFDEKEHQLEVQYKINSGTCMSRAHLVIADFFNPNLQRDFADQEFDSFLSCYQEAIDSMVRHTRSGRANQNNFSAENIEMLILRLHPDIATNQQRVQAYINLKHFLIGGEIDTLSKSEMIFIHDKVLPSFAGFLKNLAPYRSILFNAFKFNSREFQLERNQAGLEEFKKGFSTLKEQVDVLLKVLSSKHTDQQIELRRFALFFMKEFFAEDSTVYEKHLDLIEAFKSIAINDSGPFIQRTQLKMLVSQGLTVFEALAQFKFFVHDQNVFDNIGSLATFITRVPTLLEHGSVFKGVALSSFDDIMGGFDRVLRTSAQAHPQGLIAFDKIEKFFLSLMQSEVMTGPLSPKTLNLFLKRFSQKWLIDDVAPTPDLTLGKIAYIKSIIDTWIGRQKFVNQVFANLEDAETVNFNEIKKQASQSKEFKNWSKIFDRVSLHQWDDDTKTVIYSKNINEISYEDLTVSNVTRTLVEVFVKPYNLKKNDPFEYLVKTDEAQEIYEVLRILGVEMRFMDSREFNSGHRSFRESNNFSTQLKNDNYMDFYESYEYLSVAFSAGQLSELIYRGLPNNCLLNDEDVLGRKIVKASCFRDFLRNNFNSYFNHLHSIQAYWQEISASSASTYAKDPYAALVEKTDESLTRSKYEVFETIELASRGGVISEKHFDMGEIRTLVSVMYYLQSIFYVFDLDRSGLIEGIELRNAESHFRDLIVGFILNHVDAESLIEQVDYGASLVVSDWEEGQSREQIANFMAPKVFIYLLKYGNLPINKLDKSIFASLLIPKIEKRVFNKTRANVSDVLSVFSAIAKMTHLSQLHIISSFLLNNQPAILQELEKAAPPECLDQFEDNIFCRWARISYCNEPVNSFFFNWMRDNRRRLFSEDLWRRNRKESVEHTMRLLAFEIRPHTTLSTQCFFPEVPNDFRVSSPKVPNDSKVTSQ